MWYEGSGTATRRWAHQDERGSVIAVSDGSGTATAINRYDEYGKPAATNVGRFQYTGQMWLAEIGLQYSKARMYGPHVGRFWQTDPIGYGGGPNRYAYVGNDPINWVDPLGLQRQPDVKPVEPPRPYVDIMGAIVVTGCRRCGPDPASTLLLPTSVNTVVGNVGGEASNEGSSIPFPPPECNYLNNFCRPWEKPPKPAPPKPETCDTECQKQRQIMECVMTGFADPAYELDSDTRRAATQQANRQYEGATRAAVNVLLFDIGRSIGQCLAMTR